MGWTREYCVTILSNNGLHEKCMMHGIGIHINCPLSFKRRHIDFTMHVCMHIDVTIQFVTKQSICTEAGVWIERSILLPSRLECESTDTVDAGDPRWNSHGRKQ
ncbi:hypothetical protein ABFA07_019384 [Porites harrisoni]